jgi:uncharacterized protein (TIGR02996 family)
MANAAGFLRAILENPDDDAPRLIYADWLDENGEPERAEFIRVQCSLALVRQTASPVSSVLASREQELRERNEAQWIPKVPVLGRGLCVGFRRGFVEEVRAEARAFVAGADRLFQLAPVRQVRLYWGDDPPYERARLMQTIASLPYLARLQSLDLSDGFIGSDGVQALAVCEYLDRLESLDLQGGHVGERGVRALVEAPWFANLTFLDLSNNDINAGAAHALAVGLDALDRAGRLRLRQLPLRGNPLRTAGTRVIRASPALRRVVRL